MSLVLDCKKRFERGLEAFEHKALVTVQHHSFRIGAGSEVVPFSEVLLKNLVENLERNS